MHNDDVILIFKYGGRRRRQ